MFRLPVLLWITCIQRFNPHPTLSLETKSIISFQHKAINYWSNSNCVFSLQGIWVKTATLSHTFCSFTWWELVFKSLWSWKWFDVKKISSCYTIISFEINASLVSKLAISQTFKQVSHLFGQFWRSYSKEHNSTWGDFLK